MLLLISRKGKSIDMEILEIILLDILYILSYSQSEYTVFKHLYLYDNEEGEIYKHFIKMIFTDKYTPIFKGYIIDILCYFSNKQYDFHVY